MFGVKTYLKHRLTLLLISLIKTKLANVWTINRLMHHFYAAEYGHQADINNADLGYDQIHHEA